MTTEVASDPNDEYPDFDYEDLSDALLTKHSSARKCGALPDRLAFDLLNVPDETTSRTYVSVFRFVHPEESDDSSVAMCVDASCARLGRQVAKVFAQKRASQEASTWARWNAAALLARQIRVGSTEEAAVPGLSAALENVRGRTARLIEEHVRSLFPERDAHKFNGGEYAAYLELLRGAGKEDVVVPARHSAKRAATVWAHLGSPPSKNPRVVRRRRL